VSEALVTGSDPRSVSEKLRLPSYFTCLSDLDSYRLVLLRNVFLSFCGHPALLLRIFGFASIALVLVIAMLGGNAAWNALFLSIKLHWRLSFLAFLPYGMLGRCANGSNDSIYAFGGGIAKVHTAAISSMQGAGSYRLWQLNDPKH